MTPVEAAEGALAADRPHDDPAIWITRLPNEAIRSRARALEAEGPRGRKFWGVPFAVKDNIDIAGLPRPRHAPALPTPRRQPHPRCSACWTKARC